MKFQANDVIRITITLVLLIAMWKGHSVALYLLVTFSAISMEAIGWIMKFQNDMNDKNLKMWGHLRDTFLKE